MKGVKRISGSKKHLFWLVVVLALIIFGVVLYQFDTFVFEDAPNIAGKLKSNLNREGMNKILYNLDEINPFRFKKNILDGSLPIYELKLSSGDIKHFEELSKNSTKQGYLNSNMNKWRNAVLKIDGKKYDIKARFRGDGSDHWSGMAKSYKIKLINGSIEGVRKLNFIIFEGRFITGNVANMFAKALNLFSVRESVGVLKINGVSQGMYYIQEQIDKDFLEFNEMSNCIILKGSDNYLEDHPFGKSGGIHFGSHLTAFVTEVSNLKAANTGLDMNKLLAKVSDLYSVESKDLKYFFNTEQMTSFLAFLTLVGNSHLISGDNLRLAYCATDGKFYPVPLSEGVRYLKLNRGGFENELFHYSGDLVPIFADLIRDDDLRQKRNKKLYAVIINNSFLEQVKNLTKSYEPYVKSYKRNKVSALTARSKFYTIRKIIESNLNLIKQNLEYAKSYVNIYSKDNALKFEIIPDSASALRFSKMKLVLGEPFAGRIFVKYELPGKSEGFVREYYLNSETRTLDLTKFLEDLKFSAGLDSELNPKKREFNLTLEFRNQDLIVLNSSEIELTNDVTGKVLNAGDVYVTKIDLNEYYGTSRTSVEGFLETYGELAWKLQTDSANQYFNDKNLVFDEGLHLIKKNIIVPEGVNLILKPGTMIKMSEGKSLISYSPVYIEGTAVKPVIITKQNSNAFGVFGIVGGENNKETEISHLKFSGGSEHLIDGIYFSGGLSIYHVANVSIKNSEIFENFADDGLNVKYSEHVVIESSKFLNNYADQIDLDFCTGEVKESKFYGNVENSEGDGLDLSGSEMFLHHNVFENFQDKGLSVGEATEVLVFKNTFIENNIGAAIKDLSVAYIVGNQFKDNAADLSLYKKKFIFGGATAHLYNNSFINEKVFKVDKESSVYDLSQEAASKLVQGWS